MQKRYPALRAISLLLKFLSVIIIASGFILTFIILFRSSIPSTFLSRFLFISGSFWLTLGVVPLTLFSLLSGLILWGIAELLICLVDIEYNTRSQLLTSIQSKVTTSSETSVKTPKLAPNPKPSLSTPLVTSTPQTNPISNTQTETKEKRKFNIKSILNKKIW